MRKATELITEHTQISISSTVGLKNKQTKKRRASLISLYICQMSVQVLQEATPGHDQPQRRLQWAGPAAASGWCFHVCCKQRGRSGWEGRQTALQRCRCMPEKKVQFPLHGARSWMDLFTHVYCSFLQAFWVQQFVSLGVFPWSVLSNLLK